MTEREKAKKQGIELIEYETRRIFFFKKGGKEYSQSYPRSTGFEEIAEEANDLFEAI